MREFVRFLVGLGLLLVAVGAQGGWRCDGVAKADSELAASVVSNAAAIAVVRTGKVDKEVSITMPMDDAAGANTTWSEWAVAGATNAAGNWRMGVVNSNFVIQARGSGGWTNGVEILKP